MKQYRLKPIWLNVDARTERILADDLGWRALSVTADQRVQCDDPRTRGNKTVRRKLRTAEKGGMAVRMVKGEVSAELRGEIDERIRAWQGSREGTQVHTTKLRPWADCRHRTYFVGRDGEGKVCVAFYCFSLQDSGAVVLMDFFFFFVLGLRSCLTDEVGAAARVSDQVGVGFPRLPTRHIRVPPRPRHRCNA